MKKRNNQKPLDFDKMAKQHDSKVEEVKKRDRARKTGGVKNKAPNDKQITAEQILKEANDRQEVHQKQPEQNIADLEELQEYRLRKRKDFEDRIRKSRFKISTWKGYAEWEETQLEFERARSVYERALEVDYRNVTLWLRYAEMEMKNKFVNHARNIWDRAVTLLPRVDQLWYKYGHMEEMLGNIAGSRTIFERWMEWQPDINAWKAYIKMELRYNEVENARTILERFVKVHSLISSWLYYAKFEIKCGNIDNAREVFERALEELAERAYDEKYFVTFAKFEEDNKEVDRARVIYKFALDHIPKHRAQDLYQKFITFEKQFGGKENIEQVIVSKKRFQYEEELTQNGHNYDVWFDLIRLEESTNDIERTRDVYERAIANIPPLQEKRYWRRYIYLWVNYALFEELNANDVNKTRDVYKSCLQLIPHQVFSFSKIWIMFARFEIRQKNLDAARAVLGNAIGAAPKDKIFQEYIKIELLLGNIDRVRKILDKLLEYNPANCKSWKQYAELEFKLEEVDRARAIYEAAIEQETLDLPEVLWKSYIDFEIALKQFDRVRALYERLLQRTKHVKVWTSFALFEASAAQVEKARELFERAEKYFKTGSLEEEDNESTETARKEQRVQLLEAWQKFEHDHGNEEMQKKIAEKMPKRLKKKRKLTSEDGSFAGWEEYYEYVFPQEEKNTNLKLLEMAYKWKQQQQQQQANK